MRYSSRFIRIAGGLSCHEHEKKDHSKHKNNYTQYRDIYTQHNYVFLISFSTSRENNQSPRSNSRRGHNLSGKLSVMIWAAMCHEDRALALTLRLKTSSRSILGEKIPFVLTLSSRVRQLHDQKSPSCNSVKIVNVDGMSLTS